MSKTARATAEPVNRVRLIGVVTGAPEERVLPSGTGIVRFRMVVAREPSAMTSGSKGRSDWFEGSAWTAAERRRALRLSVGDRIDVEGAVRRRYVRSGEAGASLVEIEVHRSRRLGAA